MRRELSKWKRVFEGILLNLFKFSRTAHKNLTLIVLLHNFSVSFMNNESVTGHIFRKTFYLNLLKNVGILGCHLSSFYCLKKHFAQLSVIFCVHPSEASSSEELIRLSHEKIVNCTGSERVEKPGIVSKFTLLTWIRVASHLIPKIAPINVSLLGVFGWCEKWGGSVYIGFWSL